MAETPIFGSARYTEAEARDAISASPFIKYRWLMPVLPGAIAALVIVRDRGTGLDFWRELLPLIALFVVLLVLAVRAPRDQTKKALEELVGAGEVDYRIDAEGITMRAAGSSSSTSWRIITRYRETALTFLFYTSPGLSHMIPKRAFGAADLEAVRALFAANVRPAGAKEGTR
jgi:hypothetical protein